MARTRRPAAKPPSIVPAIKDAARGRWAEILASVAGCDVDLLDGQHHPCPKCGGRDRFRFTDDHGGGSIICNQCARRTCGDGLASIGWLTGWTFSEVVRRVSDYLGIDPTAGAHEANGKPGKPHKHQVDPGKDLQPLPWSDGLATLWCVSKPPIVPAAITTAGGRLARYRGRYTVIDLPVIGERGSVVGHAIVNAGGGTLPKFTQRKDGSWQVEQVRKKLTHGSQPGWIGTVDRLPTATSVWKVEGITDLLALLSLPDLPHDVAVITNAMGAGEKPKTWMLQQLAGKQVYVIGDADTPGQAGAMLWASTAAYLADRAHFVKLPYPITETHGQDVRDWLGKMRTYADLLTLASQGEVIPKPTSDPHGPQVLEADDDPHRLARVNLQRYAELTEGRTLKYWRSEWYTWKGNKYCKIEVDEFRAKVSFAIKEEFDRKNIEAQEAFQRGIEAGMIDPNKEPPKARKVTPGLVTSVLDATGSLVTVPGSVELGTWLPTRERRNWISLQNGILDVDKVLANADQADCWVPNSPDWFSTVSLPYAFDLSARCDLFERIMDHNTDMDPERLKVLQEWSGYVLTPDLGEQKFLILEGEGSNGKSVYTAAVTAMLGEANVSTVPLEVFGEKFDRTATLGKLLNAAGDCGEIDKVAEGYLKPFTSGDRMWFDRKGIGGVTCRPTARLQVACNERPRFGDRSRGIWRRMLLIKFDVEITKEERIKGMDSVEFWNRSGELPGILNWAMRGLARLRAQNGFTDCESMNREIEDYKEEVNPARSFLIQYVEESSEGMRASLLYWFYKTWTTENGYRPLGEKAFGKEVRRKFPKVQRIRSGEREKRYWEYSGIKFSQDEICGEKTHDGKLF